MFSRVVGTNASKGVTLVTNTDSMFNGLYCAMPIDPPGARLGLLRLRAAGDVPRRLRQRLVRMHKPGACRSCRIFPGGLPVYRPSFCIVYRHTCLGNCLLMRTLQRTETINDTFTPEWMASPYDFVLADTSQIVRMEVYDEDVGKPDDLLGRVCVGYGGRRRALTNGTHCTATGFVMILSIRIVDYFSFGPRRCFPSRASLRAGSRCGCPWRALTTPSCRYAGRCGRCKSSVPTKMLLIQPPHTLWLCWLAVQRT
jgi:hypothetical protein